MDTVFIFHGIGGNAEENWFPWMKSELEEQGYRVIVPSFPNAHEPRLEEWKTLFALFEQFLDERSIVIGHSLGGAFALHILESLKHTIRSTFLVASVWTRMENAFDPLMKNFVDQPFDWEAIRKNAGTMHVFCSDNDPFIGVAKEEELARKLETKAKIIHGAGHFNESAGYRTFPELLHSIASLH